MITLNGTVHAVGLLSSFPSLVFSLLVDARSHGSDLGGERRTDIWEPSRDVGSDPRDDRAGRPSPGGEPPDRLAREASERAFAFSKDADAIASAAAAWGLTHLAWGRLDQPSSDEAPAQASRHEAPLFWKLRVKRSHVRQPLIESIGCCHREQHMHRRVERAGT